jgi:hypothetical protein
VCHLFKAQFRSCSFCDGCSSQAPTASSSKRAFGIHLPIKLAPRPPVNLPCNAPKAVCYPSRLGIQGSCLSTLLRFALQSWLLHVAYVRVHLSHSRAQSHARSLIVACKVSSRTGAITRIKTLRSPNILLAFWLLLVEFRPFVGRNSR